MRFLQLLLVPALLSMLAAAACAQSDEDSATRFGLRLVGAYPTDSDVRSIGSLWWGPEIDYHLTFDEYGRPTSYASFATTRAKSGFRRGSTIAAGYTKLSRKVVTNTRSTYFGYGAGVKRVRGRMLVNNILVDDSTIRPEAHVLYGREFNDTFFGELQYQYTPDSFGANWSTISLSIGTRLSF